MEVSLYRMRTVTSRESKFLSSIFWKSHRSKNISQSVMSVPSRLDSNKTQSRFTKNCYLRNITTKTLVKFSYVFSVLIGLTP